MLDICLLGIGGMMPLPGRWLSACLIRSGGESILFDCGEGTQIAWRASGWPFRPTGTILFSHVDADHVAGLPGVLFQIAHSGRTEPVTIYGPERTYEIVNHLVSLIGWLPYELRFARLDGGETLDLADNLRLSTLAVQHGKPCLAYTLDLSRAPRFDRERAEALGVPMQEWKRLQRGEPVGDVRPEDVTGPPRRGLRLALVTDTRYFEALIPFVSGSDLLVCEAMYPGDDEIERAAERGHMTATQAARLARDAGVRRLWLTHLSPSVEDPSAVQTAASAIFPAAELGQPGVTLTLRFED